MTHFSTLVITTERPTKEALQEILLPWHEYECTGIERYLTWVDYTDEVTAEWAGDAACQARYKTLADYAREYHGYDLRDDGRIGRLTNPNAKWDWWKVGGRYKGRLLTNDAKEPVDQALRGSLRLEDMRSAAVANRQENLEAALAELEKMGSKREAALALWRTYALGYRTARTRYEALVDRPSYRDWFLAHQDEPDVAVVLGCVETPVYDHLSGLFGVGVPDDEPDPAAWVAAAPAFSCWAVVKDGVWFEKGKMGWWGMSHDDMPDREWQDQLQALLRDGPLTSWLTVVDCHI
jgi:hypothetical protein